MLSKPLAERDREFANRLQMWMNSYDGQGANIVGVAKAISGMHRAMIPGVYNFGLYILVALYSDYEEGRYDGRDEGACRKAHTIIKTLIEQGVLSQTGVAHIIERLNAYI